MAEDSQKLEMIRSLLESAEGNVRSAKQLINEMTGGKTESLRQKASSLNKSEDGKVIEGIFDGQAMIDGDGKNYPVPANYASKSKLVEGDGLKLTILADGSFIYKQILPIPRKKIIGSLTMDGDQYRVLAEGKSYKVLYASVTYYKGQVGDQVTLIVPEDKEASWGAVENIIPGSPSTVADASDAPAPTSAATEEREEAVEPSADVQDLTDSVESAVADAKEALGEPEPTLAQESESEEASQQDNGLMPSPQQAAEEVAPEPTLATPEKVIEPKNKRKNSDIGEEEASASQDKQPSVTELDI